MDLSVYVLSHSSCTFGHCSNQTTLTFLRCLKRFASRRGLPRKFLYDNGKTFKAAAKYMKAIFQDGTVKEHLAELSCEWVFNVERVPWWGGVFERMVKSTKRCLRKVIRRAHLSHDELLTAVTEIGGTSNSNLPDYIGYQCDSNDDEESQSIQHNLRNA